MDEIFANIVDIKRFAVHDGDGIRTAVFFKGCPLRCRWCHNPETLSDEPQIGFFGHKCALCGECVRVCPRGCHKTEGGIHRFDRAECVLCGKCADACPADALKKYGERKTVAEILDVLLRDKRFYEESGGGITLSGGECLMQSGACAEILKSAKSRGISTAVDTCGFVPRKAIRAVLPFTDVFLYDLKHIDEAAHIAGTGQSNGIILDNLRFLSEEGAALEIRYPLIPGFNDGEDAVTGAAEFLAALRGIKKIRVLRYHDFARSKYVSLGYRDTMPDAEKAEDPDFARRIFVSITGVETV